MHALTALWTAIQPALTAAIISLITAGAAWIVRGLQAKGEIQRQAVAGAVAQVDEMARPARVLGDIGRKLAAMALVEQRLPPSHLPATEKLGDMIEAEVDRAHSSRPPPMPGNG